MSGQHLTTGSPFPPLQENKFRIYSMRYCPFAQRSRLALAAKGIDHEVINCNLKQKPEWFLEKTPKGLVPVVEHGDKVVYESMIVNDYLDELFPEKRPLNPKDPYQKTLDRIVLDMFNSEVVPAYFKVLYSKGEDEEGKKKIASGLVKMEAELKKRGTAFYCGNQPGMLDYNMWPFMERIHLMAMSVNQVYFDDKLPLLTTYVNSMLSDPAVKATMVYSPQLHVKYLEGYRVGKPNFDITL